MAARVGVLLNNGCVSACVARVCDWCVGVLVCAVTALMVCGSLSYSLRCQFRPSDMLFHCFRICLYFDLLCL